MGKIKQLEQQLINAKTKTEKEKIKKEIEKSKRGRSSRVKGATYENKIAKLFNKTYEEFDLSLKRTPLSGGFSKDKNNPFLCGDLTCLNDELFFLLHIECKNQKKVKIMDWVKQARSDCPSNKIFSVIFHTSQQEHGFAEDFITLPLKDFLELVPGDNIIVTK